MHGSAIVSLQGKQEQSTGVGRPGKGRAVWNAVWNADGNPVLAVFLFIPGASFHFTCFAFFLDLFFFFFSLWGSGVGD